MTLKEIAKLSGVSPSTVSKIINKNDQHISSETKERVLAIVKKYNYRPYECVKQPFLKKTFQIGIVENNISSSHLILSGIIKAASNNAYASVVLYSNNSLDREFQNLTLLVKSNVDAIIWNPVNDESKQYEKLLRDWQIPFEIISDDYYTEHFQIDFDNLGYALANRLIQLEHKKIACLIKEPDQRTHEFIEGLKRCLYDNGILFNASMCLSILSKDYISALIQNKYTGVICPCKSIALDLYQNLTTYHYNIPNDVSVACLKDAPDCENTFPQISGIVIPYFNFGYNVCTEIISRCEHLATPKGILDISYNIDDSSSIKKRRETQNRFIVLGSIVNDVTLKVDYLPRQGKTTLIQSEKESIGGKGFNQAVSLARLGNQVSLIGAIGNDLNSNSLLKLLSKENVNFSGIYKATESTLGKSYIYIEPNGENSINYLPGANKFLSKAHIKQCRKLFSNIKYCILTSDVPMESIVEAATVARSFHAKTILKPSAINYLSSALLDKIDFFIPNRKEAETLCPLYKDHIDKQANYFFTIGFPVVIITLGARGCYLKTQTIDKYFEALDIPPVDTSGGAVTFITVFATYHAKGYDLERSIRIATCAAGLCISKKGIVPSLIDIDSLEEEIDKIDRTLLIR